MAESNQLVDDDVISEVRAELEQALSTVQELETDAERKGVPLTVTGARYRIYETEKKQD